MIENSCFLDSFYITDWNQYAFLCPVSSLMHVRRDIVFSTKSDKLTPIYYADFTSPLSHLCGAVTSPSIRIL